jgi:hypothetical protein
LPTVVDPSIKPWQISFISILDLKGGGLEAGFQDGRQFLRSLQQ